MSQIDLVPPVANIVAAVNRADSAAFVAQFAAAGVVDDWGTRYVGHAAITQWSDREVIGVKQIWNVTGVDGSGDQISIMADVSGGGFNGPSRFSFVLQVGLVKEMKITDK